MKQQDIEFLEENGWIVECESPLEIRDQETGSFATGYAAKCVLASLREEEKENQKQKEFKLNPIVRQIMKEALETAEYPEYQQYIIEPNQYFCAKFAELMVEECSKVILSQVELLEAKNPYQNDFETNTIVTVHNSVGEIKQHFGIK